MSAARESASPVAAAAPRVRAQRVLLQLLGLGLAAGLAWWARGSLAAAVGVARRSSPAWLLLAAAAELLSLASLAREQRRLVAAGGVGPVPLRAALATAYAGNLISVALPLAGSSLSAAYTFRRYVGARVPAAQVATGLAVSWVIASSVFTAVVAVAAAGTGHVGLVVAGVLGGLASAAAVAALVLGLRSRTTRGWVGAVAVRVLPVLQRATRRLPGDPKELVRATLDQLASTRLRLRDLGAASGSAVLFWTADLACLGFALRTVGSPVSLTPLALTWSAGIGARSLSLTPGGIGLVEGALTGALVGAGLHATTALAGVLVYRLLSLWLVAAIGAVVLASNAYRSAAAVRRALDRA